MVKAHEVERDFYRLRDQLNQEAKLFEDNRFENELEGEFQSCIWERPKTFRPSPVFADDDSMTSSFRKGAMSSDSFAIVVDIMRAREELMRYVVAQDQSFAANYAGMFLFRFWRFDRVVPMIVDDTLPIDPATKHPLLTTFVDNESLWCTLMEKAYAKFLGGYELLRYAKLPEVMRDILGCAVHLFPVRCKGNATVKMLSHMIQYDGVLIVSLHDQSFPLDKNMNTLFTVTSLTQQGNEEAGKNKWILTLKNSFTPPVKGVVPEDEANLEEEMDNLNEVNSTDLVADWNETLRISLDTFLEVFDELYVGLMRYPELSTNLWSKMWETKAIVSRWGDLRQSEDKHYNNPFLKVVITKSDTCNAHKMCTLMISLLQYCEYTPGKKLCNEIGLIILGLRDTEGLSGRIPKKLLSLANPVVQTDLYAEREISLHVRLEPGEYIIIPHRKRNCCESTKKCQKYSITLFSIEPVSVTCTGLQKYGKDYLTPLELEIEAPQYVVVGDTIKIAVKIKGMPPMTRFTITMMMRFSRTSSEDPLETLIKARLEYIEVCQGLIDKQLSMTVGYHEYIKFPLASEEFMASCSAYVHELATDVKTHKVVTTMMPKLKMAIDRKLYTRQQCLMTALLQNSLPITIHSAKMNILCSSKGSVKSNSTQDVPPFTTAWIICLMRFDQPGCQVVQIIFTSSLFYRSVCAKVQVTSSVSPVQLCPSSENSLLLGEFPPINTKLDTGNYNISCCPNHKTISEKLDKHILKPSWFIDMKGLVLETAEYDCSSDEAHMMYCRQSKEYTPNAEFPEELLPIELKL